MLVRVGEEGWQAMAGLGADGETGCAGCDVPFGGDLQGFDAGRGQAQKPALGLPDLRRDRRERRGSGCGGCLRPRCCPGFPAGRRCR